MYKLVIIDDEKIIRETISTIIDWKSLDIEIVGVCKDGIDAYDCILDECPDIVMTDIRMPGLSGLDLIDKVNENNLDIEFIILSGYGEFDYAQKAISQGVLNYLLKPCSEEDIILSINKAIASCQNKYQKLLNATIDDMFQNKNIGKNILLCKTLLNKIKDEHFIQMQLQRILLESSNSNTYSISLYKVQEYLKKIKEQKDLFYLRDLSIELIDMIFNNKNDFKTGDCVERVVEYVNLHISDSSLSLKWISENYLYMNADYVSKQFLKQTGEKFSQYLTSTRINEAKKILKTEGSESLQDIAQKVGFGNNPQYFSQIFKKYTSMTPGNYVKNFI